VVYGFYGLLLTFLPRLIQTENCRALKPQFTCLHVYCSAELCQYHKSTLSIEREGRGSVHSSNASKNLFLVLCIHLSCESGQHTYEYSYNL